MTTTTLPSFVEPQERPPGDCKTVFQKLSRQTLVEKKKQSHDPILRYRSGIHYNNRELATFGQECPFFGRQVDLDEIPHLSGEQLEEAEEVGFRKWKRELTEGGLWVIHVYLFIIYSL